MKRVTSYRGSNRFAGFALADASSNMRSSTNIVAMAMRTAMSEKLLKVGERKECKKRL
jgi:hypothetical protein